jgi:DHA1 family tetracycline resistance protein-like MFS transporter
MNVPELSDRSGETHGGTASAGPTRGSLAVLFLTVFIDLLGFGLVLPLLPLYADQYQAAPWMIGLLFSSFSIMQFLFAPVWGRLSDRVGRRPVLMIGLGGSVLFYSLFGVAALLASLPLLFVSRIGAGVAGATIPIAQAYIADTTTLQGRSKGMALIGAAFGLGFTFGPLLGLAAVPSGEGDPGPGPGFVAAGLSAVALVLAWFQLPESYTPGSQPAARWLLDSRALRTALARPSLGVLIAALFICVFSLANFETTLSLLLKGSEQTERLAGGFDFSFRQVCLTYAYIGLVLMLAQGVVVRRVAGRIPDHVLAATGAVIELSGFLGMIYAISEHSLGLLFGAMAVVVCGFSFMMPSINALISRRSDPAQQGAVLGLGQSAASLARIVGPLASMPLLYRGASLPYWLAGGLVVVGGALVLLAGRRGGDFPSDAAAGSELLGH